MTIGAPQCVLTLKAFGSTAQVGRLRRPTLGTRIVARLCPLHHTGSAKEPGTDASIAASPHGATRCRSNSCRFTIPENSAGNGTFRGDRATVVGRTRIGRTTIRVLAMNDPDFVAFRAELMEEGVYGLPGSSFKN